MNTELYGIGRKYMSEFETNIQLKDKDDDKTISLYLFELVYDNVRYGGEIPAHSWKEANEMVKHFGGKVIGLAVEERSATLCGVCSGDIVKDLENVKPLVDEVWEEHFD